MEKWICFSRGCKKYGWQRYFSIWSRNLSNPNQIQFHNIESAKEMHDKLIQLIDYKDFDYIFMSAAISDYYTKKS